MENNAKPIGVERTGSIPEDIIEARDKVTSSPNERTLKVWNLLAPKIKSKEISNWDIICFCLGFLAKQVNVYEVFKEPVILLGRYVINLHYLFPELTTEGDNGVLEKQESVAKSGE